eukprot:CAMPEP_0194573348 /NCGR_PEP_ID=MMETSP0292-20121207/9591_1 /TAXON_ID=39354 /ORGANISM="Heterosigma akashiwo, Strain CCMP2393" /LENGTH=297 /DNA_ID=CAMNT_0039424563 /DNA_START=57 /DNA_END=950 /DNA_ORIENTATION=+
MKTTVFEIAFVVISLILPRSRVWAGVHSSQLFGLNSPGGPSDILKSSYGLSSSQPSELEIEEIPFRKRSDFEIESSSEGTPNIEFLHGTTTLAFIYQGGIVIAVDSRASMGAYISSRTTMKLLPVSRGVVGTMAGGAADCAYWLRRAAARAQLFELAHGRPMSVGAVAKALALDLRSLRGAGLSVGTMLAGFDAGRRPRLFYVDDQGAHVAGGLFAVGSGATYAYGVLDEYFRPDLTTQEALALARRAIRGATYRDAYSGGFVNLVHLTPDGWRQVDHKDVAEIAVVGASQQEQLFQ